MQGLRLRMMEALDQNVVEPPRPNLDDMDLAL